MQVELRNIGPVNHAAIELDGLSVLVGPNASGKTTLSTACYAVLISHHAARFAVQRYVRAALLGGEETSESRTIRRDLGERFSSAFRERLSKEFERCYSPDLGMLPRRGRTGNGSAPRVIVSHSYGGEPPWKLIFKIRDGALSLETKHPDFKLPKFRSEVTLIRRSGPLRAFRRLMDEREGVSPVYFPAARSGYAQMSTVLESLLIGALGRGYFDQVSVGKISGVAADFLQFLAGIQPNEKSSLPAGAAEALESDLLHGHLRLRSAGDAGKLIEFAPEGLNEYWPMDAAATSVAEVAPLLLYLRHRAAERDLVFIDEPEAHLHPANQLVLADVLLALSDHIAGLIVGTHSEFFVTGVSNGLMRRTVNGAGNHASVSLYELVPAKATGGFEAIPSGIDQEGGFSVRQFVDVADSALDEAESLFEQSHLK
jgi:energy-coupling factor transporter ATP-binding protein EcfA2